MLVTMLEGAQKLTSWRGPVSFILGKAPVERKCHGLTSAFDKIFIFGGASSSGGKTFTNNQNQYHKSQIMDY